MEIGFIGLGRMGSNMVQRLLEGGHRVVAYDVVAARVEEAHQKGAVGVGSLPELVSLLSAPRAIWMMIPAGELVSQTIQALRPHLSPGDLLIDGGNSNFRDSMLRARALATDRIDLMDIGVSGGIWGLENGYCLMAGGTDEGFGRVEPALKTLAPEKGYAHVGPIGAGHFTKMVHNGIEYGLLQAYGEGFELLKSAQEGFSLDLHQLAELWNHGSVVRSWLLELTEMALRQDPELSGIRGFVEDSGEGRWTVHEAIDAAVPVPVIALSLFARFRSRQEDSFSARVIAALRQEFGGHAVRPEVGARGGD